MNKALLVNRTWNINHDRTNWYSAMQFLKSYKSVVQTYFLNTSSSAGDWSGVIVQLINKRYHLIAFNQTNNWTKQGFTLTTGNVLAVWSVNPSREEVLDVLAESCWPKRVDLLED